MRKNEGAVGRERQPQEHVTADGSLAAPSTWYLQGLH